ncbi:MAG: hypothetical protein VX700_10880 [Pseudomonadota bacterium]|nr:hypothetical protein [Pseudomonadota bacterium]
MKLSEEHTSTGRAKTVKPEYLLIGALLLIGAVAVPAMQNVYLVQSFVLSICTGLGFN